MPIPSLLPKRTPVHVKFTSSPSHELSITSSTRTTSPITHQSHTIPQSVQHTKSTTIHNENRQIRSSRVLLHENSNLPVSRKYRLTSTKHATGCTPSNRHLEPPPKTRCTAVSRFPTPAP